MATTHTHDVLTLGASAGGFEALGKLFGELPKDFPAAVFVALHTHPTGVHAAELLAAKARMPVALATHGERIEHGRVYVAPADMHLLVRAGHVDVVRGPRENGHRPSVDVLFRSAARTYASRVIGVVLTGYQDCGTTGLMSIKARGGIAVVQDPNDAAVPEMPQSSIDNVEVDHVAPLADMPELLQKLVATPAPDADMPASEEVLEIEGEQPAVGVSLSCPLCHGALAETKVGAFDHFRCHVGHSFSLDVLAEAQDEDIERALWAAVRSLEDGANLSKRVAARSTGELRERSLERARVQLADAQRIRDLLIAPKNP